MTVPMFLDRDDAGRRLADVLAPYAAEDPVVLALPRGGVVVGHAVARRLGAPLDVVVSRKLGAPGHPELAVGAVAPGGIRVLDDEIVLRLGVSTPELDEATARELLEVRRRLRTYRGSEELPDVRGRTVIVVDDGVATGATARAALQAVRGLGARRVVFAAPVGPRDAEERLRRDADEVVLLETPAPFHAVGLWYRDFDQTLDEEVLALLRDAQSVGRTASRIVRVPAGDGMALDGDLATPRDAAGVVVFVHGSGSGRMSPRNRAVARDLQERGFATLLVDLLTPDEAEHDARDRSLRFDIPLLAGRVALVVDWLRTQPATRDLPVALQGSSTGAAAALRAAAARPGDVRAVVSRGGRVDLAGDALPEVRAATLLLVGSLDRDVLRLNEEATHELDCTWRLDVIEGTGHLFEEPGALDEVARVAAEWFGEHLRRAREVAV